MLLTLMVFEHNRQIILFLSWRPLCHSFVLYLDEGPLFVNPRDWSNSLGSGFEVCLRTNEVPVPDSTLNVLCMLFQFCAI